MKITVVLFLALLLITLTACDWLPIEWGDTPLVSTESVTESASTLPADVTPPATEVPTTEAGEFPNDPDDDHSKRY